ncbi:MAG: hypothetical protein ACJASQ_000581 [Crocinitomicaceae bacterium]|jgi:hypothetical protein
MKRKSIVLMMIAAVLVGSCAKKSEEVATPTLEVEENNSILIAKHTWTGCGPCGGWGFTNFENLITSNPDEVHVAFKMGNVGPYNNNAIYDHILTAFEIPGGTPKFHNNLNASLGVALAGQMQDDAGVILNANYEMEFTDDNKIKLNTTTKFFQNTEGKYRLAPFLIVDNIEAPQSGHPDTPNTLHKKVVVDIARPYDIPFDYNGYLIASGEIKTGHTINLECEVDRDPSWAKEDVSFALLMFKENPDGSLVFVNAFSK